jgi:hypothetical protein
MNEEEKYILYAADSDKCALKGCNNEVGLLSKISMWSHWCRHLEKPILVPEGFCSEKCCQEMMKDKKKMEK